MSIPGLLPPIDAQRKKAVSHKYFFICTLVYLVLAVALFWEPLFTDTDFLPCSPREWPPWNETDSLSSERQSFKSNPLLSDTPLYNYMGRFYNHELFRKGQIPFWNPFILSGNPHVAELGSLALYPLTIPFDFWDPLLGNVYSLIIHLTLAGLFLFLFLRKMGQGFGPSLIGGLIFEFNGFFLSNMGFPAAVFAGTWIPLLLMGIHDVIWESHWRSSWKIAVAIFFMMLAGFPQILVISLILGSSWACFEGWTRIRKDHCPRLLVKRVMAIPLLFLLGGGLAGFGVSPFYELLLHTTRKPVPFDNYQFISMPSLALVQAVVPDFFGNPVDRNYWLRETQPFFNPQPESANAWRWNYSSQNIFIGIGPLLLALYGLLYSRSRESLFFGGAAAVALLVLLGAPLISKLFYNFVPAFKYSRPDRIIFLYMFSISVLAALGCSRATNRVPAKRAANWIPWALLSLPILPQIWKYCFSPGWRESLRRFLDVARQKLSISGNVVNAEFLEAVAVAALVILAIFLLRVFPKGRPFILGLIVFLMVMPLFRFFWRFYPMQPSPVFPNTNEVDLLQKDQGLFRIAHIGMVLPPNSNLIYGLFSANGISVAPLDSYSQLIRKAVPNAFRRDKYFLNFPNHRVLKSSLLDFLNVGYFVSREKLEMPGPV